ncbi:hypothetical protein F511_30540 [Dorcoceras hygrometricum]|uniref:Uncharacterized protein n=1 Tax=Dorcoceras hygrometricum TaxID=472368 RepID=A0A2Z7BYQ7_9LAMI|nr:hypothetical protein F511_30540 [Dorcoceras hygrometricum]
MVQGIQDSGFESSRIDPGQQNVGRGSAFVEKDSIPGNSSSELFGDVERSKLVDEMRRLGVESSAADNMNVNIGSRDGSVTSTSDCVNLGDEGYSLLGVEPCDDIGSKGYFRFWAVIAIAWGTIASVVIIALPLMESWETIQSVMLGMFTNDRMMEKMEELNLKLQTIVSLLPDAEKMYLLEKEKAKKKEATELEIQIVPENSSTWQGI